MCLTADGGTRALCVACTITYSLHRDQASVKTFLMWMGWGVTPMTVYSTQTETESTHSTHSGTRHTQQLQDPMRLCGWL
jgi:hypothetical protein